jgi:hypothetical protein
MLFHAVTFTVHHTGRSPQTLFFNNGVCDVQTAQPTTTLVVYIDLLGPSLLGGIAAPPSSIVIRRRTEPHRWPVVESPSPRTHLIGTCVVHRSAIASIRRRILRRRR